jgi:hypothetical protein
VEPDQLVWGASFSKNTYHWIHGSSCPDADESSLKAIEEYLLLLLFGRMSPSELELLYGWVAKTVVGADAKELEELWRIESCGRRDTIEVVAIRNCRMQYDSSMKRTFPKSDFFGFMNSQDTEEMNE